MKRMQSWQRLVRSAIVVAGLTALLGGCVVYPIDGGGGGGHRHYYWHGR